MSTSAISSNSIHFRPRLFRDRLTRWMEGFACGKSCRFFGVELNSGIIAPGFSHVQILYDLYQIR